MKGGLVSPDVLLTFGFTYRKPTDNTVKYNPRPQVLTYFENPRISYIFIKPYMILRTFNAVFKLSYEIMLFECFVGFSPTFGHCYR